MSTKRAKKPASRLTLVFLGAMADVTLLPCPLIWHGKAGAPAAWATAVVLGTAVLAAVAVVVGVWRPSLSRAARVTAGSLLAFGAVLTALIGFDLFTGNSGIATAGLLLLGDAAVPLALLCGQLLGSPDQRS
ncbi:hypothetical protein ACFZB9_15230 [Kitasatospora sp. NPDC008050]|uniref:hypothetical protein n=1 Tax=Kitasatospora sp. NPDC008050 TaxID=3364021 RepID=UPI0036ECB10A